LIESKKLQLNHIWATKITQEDMSTPKQFDDNKINVLVNKVVFDSIIKLANNINDTFQRIFRQDEIYFEECEKIMLQTNALIHKIKIFMEIKVKLFKINEEMMEPLKALYKYYSFMRSNIGVTNLAKKIEEFYNTLND